MQSTPVTRTTQPPQTGANAWVDDYGSEIAVGLVVGLVVAAVVWLTGQPVSWWRRRQENEAARKAISAEIGSNLIQLEGLWEDLSRPLGNFDFRPCYNEEIGGLRLTRVDSLRWRRTAWEDRSVQALAALSPEDFPRVQQFYYGLARLDLLKSSLGKPMETLKGCWRLSSDGARAWKEFQEVVNRLLETGNPLLVSENSD